MGYFAFILSNAIPIPIPKLELKSKSIIKLGLQYVWMLKDCINQSDKSSCSCVKRVAHRLRKVYVNFDSDMSLEMGITRD